jgi:hypothetical protein
MVGGSEWSSGCLYIQKILLSNFSEQHFSLLVQSSQKQMHLFPFIQCFVDWSPSLHQFSPAKNNTVSFRLNVTTKLNSISDYQAVIFHV